ncbi:prepilin-type N-terminal cleavage/methylation domain-containing protein [Candidatus Peregrinibacteria bacterium]|nr:prepilin-type N-terminal cleavage/methylation domain-containing protein [Candidatus Peregrinibacteria bacterium]
MAQSVIKIKGFSIVEVLLAITIFAIFSSAILYLSLNVIQQDSKIELDNTALLYAQEGLEAARNIRDRNFLLLSNGDHGLNFASDEWTFIQAPENVDNFYFRTLTVSDVYRDVNGAISQSGTLDPDTKLISSEVNWLQNNIFPRSITLNTYLTNWQGDDWISTTCPEFDAGTHTDTESIIADSPPADNCSIQLGTIEDPSNFFSSADIGDHGNDVFIEGNYAFIASNITNKGLSIVDISDPVHPLLISELDIGGKGNQLTKLNNYLFIAVEKNDKGLAIVDVSNPLMPLLVRTLNVGDEGISVAASGSYLYLGIEDDDDSLKIIEISNPQLPIMTSSVDFNSEVQSIYLDNNYAYLGLGDDTHGFRVLDISNVVNPVSLASLNVGEEVNAITVSGIFAFVGTEQSNNSLQLINISNPVNPLLISSLNVNGEIQDLSISGEYLYAALDDQNAGLAAINISSPATPVFSYNLDVMGKGTGIASTVDYLYISTDTSNKGLVIVGTTSSEIISTGTYESEIFDTGSIDTRYNFIEWDHLEVPGATIKFQIRTADSAAGINSAVWVGSDGTNASYYENSRTQIVGDPAATGPQFFQYRAFISSDGVNTPILESVRINYTP